MKKPIIFLLCLLVAVCFAGCSAKKQAVSRRNTSSTATVVSEPTLETSITEDGDDIIHFSSYSGRETTVTYHFNGEVLASISLTMKCGSIEDADAQYENFTVVNQKTTKPVYSDISRNGLTISLKYTSFGMTEFKGFTREQLKVYLDELQLLK